MEHGRQSKRVAKRRQGAAEPPVREEVRYIRENTNAVDARRARFMMVAAGLVFIGACVGYVLLAAGEILG